MAARLRARSDGLLESDALPQVPLMAPRLQGELGDEGVLVISIWGTGEVGRIRFAPASGPYVIAPNRVQSPRGGLFVAQSAPVLVLRGVRPTDTWPTGTGGFIVEPRGDDFVVAAGDDELEAGAALGLSADAIEREANDHAARCDLMPAADPLLRSLVITERTRPGRRRARTRTARFAGLAAGLAYSNPPRTYYRDGYWTLQLLRRLAPEIAAGKSNCSPAVQDERRSAQRGDRQRPSRRGLRTPSPGRCGDGGYQPARRASGGATTSTARSSCAGGGRAGAASGDDALAKAALAAADGRLPALHGPARSAGLPVKPHNDRDWADNVYREGLVAYDIGLWVGALDALARLGVRLDPALGQAARAEAAAARAAAHTALWRGDHYADYVRADGWAEAHLALDALMLLRFDAVPEARALTVLEQVRQKLESRRDAQQPYGDFGMLCAFPPFADHAALRAKSAYPYRYHNGGEWPWLDAVYAAERLRRGLGGWHYPLTRWWSYALEQGWAGAVEHYSVPYGRGSLLQGWSSLPAAVALQYADRVLAGDPDAA